MTETWLAKNESQTMADLLNSLQDYAIYHHPRHGRGGAATIIRKGFSVKKNPWTHYKSFEILDLNVSLKYKSFWMLTVYWSPPSKKNKLSTSMFFSDFSDLLEGLLMSLHNLMSTKWLYDVYNVLCLCWSLSLSATLLASSNAVNCGAECVSFHRQL